MRVDTEQEPTFRYWVELPEAEPVKFGVLPTLMARALHSDAFAQAGAEINFEEALGKMVDAGTLKVRDPLTFGRHTFPIGEALRRAVLLPREDVGPLLASFQIGLRLTGEEWPLKKPQSEEGKSPPLEHWKMRIQAEAADEWRRLRAMNCNPTRASIRPHLLKWCKQNNVKTGGGINPSDGYLRTHVLSGKHWAPPTE